MGNNSIAMSSDVDAIGTNPANLLSGPKGILVIEFLPVSLYAGNDVVDIDFYNKYFTGTGQYNNRGDENGKVLTASDKASILAAFPDSVGNFLGGVNARVIGLSWSSGNFGVGVAIDEIAGSKLELPSTVLFPLNGNSPGSTFNWNKLAGSIWWYTESSVDLALRIPDLTKISRSQISDIVIGVAPKYVAGYGYATVVSRNSSIYTDPETYDCELKVNFTSQQSGIASAIFSENPDNESGKDLKAFDPFHPAGMGIGADFGMSARLFRFFTLGISVTDLGKIYWSRNDLATSADTTIVYSGYSSPTPQDIDVSEVVDSIQNVLRTVIKGTSSPSSHFTTSLPTKVGISIAVHPDEILHGVPGQIIVALEFRRGLNNNFGNSTSPEYGVGAEWRPFYTIPIRTGVRFGGDHGMRWSAGTGISTRYWDFDLGFGDMEPLIYPTKAKAVSLAFSALKFKI